MMTFAWRWSALTAAARTISRPGPHSGSPLDGLVRRGHQSARRRGQTAGVQAARRWKLIRTFASCCKARMWTRSPSPRPIIGTPWPRFGACKPARTSMSKSRFLTTFGKARKWSKAAHRYKKIVQAGTQSRSSHGIKEAVEWVQKGNLGKIRVARGLCYKPRPASAKRKARRRFPPRWITICGAGRRP
jgi:hypothetical protein